MDRKKPLIIQHIFRVSLKASLHLLMGMALAYVSVSLSAADAPVPATGQTLSQQVHDDGDLQAGVAWPAPRFVDSGDGTVVDQLTGLIWLRNPGALSAANWTAALDAVATL